MAYVPSARTVTALQTADGASLDLLGLDRGLQDVVDRHNAYGRGDLAQRWTRQQYVLGYEPPISDAPAIGIEEEPTKLPFARVHNTQTNTDSASPSGYADFGENSWRHKGHDVTVVDPKTIPIQDTDQYAWTTSLLFTTPVIVDELSVILQNSTLGREPYNNSWIYTNPPGVGFKSPATQIEPAAAADYVSDIVVQMQVDSDLSRNAAELSDLAVNFWDWRADGRLVRNYAGASDSIQPFSVNGPVTGLWVHLKELNVPIPAFAKIRFSLILPWYLATVWNVDGSWNVFGGLEAPWRRQAYHVTATVLEPLRAGAPSSEFRAVAESGGGGIGLP